MGDKITQMHGRNVETAPTMSAEQQFLALEFLLANGTCVGKTKSVAARYLDFIAPLMDRKGDRSNWVDDESGARRDHHIEGQGLYIIFKLGDKWKEANVIGRRATAVKICKEFILRALEEDDVNNPTYQVPDVWTNNKIASFEEDYTRRDDIDPVTGKRTDIWDPNPDARRLVARVNENMTMATTWGTQSVMAGGALAIREADIPQAYKIIRAVREEGKSIEQAMFKYMENGQKRARVDTYFMDPGDCELTYNPTDAKETTKEFQAKVRGGSNDNIGVSKFEFPEDRTTALQMQAEAQALKMKCA